MYNKIFNDNKNNYVIETVENWNSGIYIEVPENKIPAKVKETRLGGCGSGTYIGEDYYFTSNTSGELLHRTFKHCTKLPIYKIKNEENLLKLKEKNISFNEGYELLAKTLERDDLKFTLRKARFDQLYKGLLDNKYFEWEEEELKKNRFGKLIFKFNKEDFYILQHELENINCFKEMTDYIFKEKKIIDSISIDFVFKFDKKNLELFEKIQAKNNKDIDKNKANEILDLLKVSDFRWKHWINILN